MSIVAAGTARDQSAPLRRPSALVLDDQRLLAEALAERLALDGFDATVATTAAEALEHSGKRWYDVAFVDLKLPDMSGAMVARELKKRSPRLQVIVMTGFAALVDDPELVDTHVDGVLPKPWRAAELDAILRKLGGS